MNSEKVCRAGLIGCGGVSRSHSTGLQAARGVEPVALADVYAPNLETAGEAYGVGRRHLRQPHAREGLPRTIAAGRRGRLARPRGSLASATGPPAPAAASAPP
jgi:hypothetical protein